MEENLTCIKLLEWEYICWKNPLYPNNCTCIVFKTFLPNEACVRVLIYHWYKQALSPHLGFYLFYWRSALTRFSRFAGAPFVPYAMGAAFTLQPFPWFLSSLHWGDGCCAWPCILLIPAWTCWLDFPAWSQTLLIHCGPVWQSLSTRVTMAAVPRPATLALALRDCKSYH